MGWVLGSLAAAQIDFSLFGKGELEGFEISVLVRAVAKRLIC